MKTIARGVMEYEGDKSTTKQAHYYWKKVTKNTGCIRFCNQFESTLYCQIVFLWFWIYTKKVDKVNFSFKQDTQGEFRSV